MTKLDAILKLVDEYGDACVNVGEWELSDAEAHERMNDAKTALIAALREALGEKSAVQGPWDAYEKECGTMNTAGGESYTPEGETK